MERGRPISGVHAPRSPLDTREKGLPVLDDTATLQDYLVYAALNNPGLEAAFDRWQAALESVPQVRALPDPRFTYAYFIREVETRVGPQQHKFRIAQMFPWFGKLELRGNAAGEEAEAARQRYEAQKVRLFYEVKEAYYEYYYLGRAIAVVRDQLRFVTYLEGVVRTRYRAAAAKYADVIRAQVELGKLDDQLRSLQDLREPVVAGINAALNRPIWAELPWPAEVAEAKVDATDEQIFLWLEESSPELKELDHWTAKAGIGIDLARKNFYPDVTFGLDYIQTGGPIMSTPDAGKDPVIAMVSINVPLWYGKLRAAVREAEARQRASANSRTNLENVLSARVKLALYKWRDAERKIDLYRDTLLPKARQSLRAYETAFMAGTATFLDVVDAIRVLLHFELSYERALADHAKSLAGVEKLIGRELPRAGPTDGPGSSTAPIDGPIE
jgi:outer membrane protein TolC